MKRVMWTEAETATLIQRVTAQVSDKQIARELGRTPNAVTLRLRLLREKGWDIPYRFCAPQAATTKARAA